MTSRTSSVCEASVRFDEALEGIRRRLLASQVAARPEVRARGLYFLQSLRVVAFNNYIAPNTRFPALYVQPMFMPFELTWGIQCPDFLNHNGFIDGAHCYRIYGNCRDFYWATIQVLRGFWGDQEQGMLANVDFDDVLRDADGNFEIFLGPKRPARAEGKTFVELDPAARNIMLAMRETAIDWERTRPMDVHIEILDREADARIYYREDELAARIDKATKFAEACYEHALRQMSDMEAEGAHNQFVQSGPAASHARGGSPLGAWMRTLYEIESDEALIIEMPAMSARYWGVQLGSVWMQTTDYSYHQSSINCAQAHIDPDGRFRAVLAMQDPGVPNWLDPVGLPFGVAMLRIYKFETVAVPEVVKVKLADVRRHIHPDTPIVSPEERARRMDVRRRASLMRYGQ